MKKTKFLIPLLSTTTLLAGATGILASCSRRKAITYIEAAEKDVSIVGNDIYGYMTFTLKDEIGDKVLTVSVDEPASIFVFGEPIVTHKLVSLPVVWKGPQTETDVKVTWNLTFKCTDGDKTVYWENTIKDCSATYKPTVVLDKTKSTKDGITSVLTDDDYTMTGTFYFTLTDELEDERLSLKPWVWSSSSNYVVDNTKTKIEIDPENKHQAILTLVTTKTNSKIAIGDKFEFSFQIECLYNGEYTYWQSVKMNNFSLSYSIKEVDIDFSAFHLTPISSNADDGYILDSIDWTKAGTNPNTLYVPAKKDYTSWIRKIGDFKNYTVDPLQLKQHGITKIKFGGIGIQEVAPFAFYGVNTIQYIDLSGIDDDVKSLKKLLTFGEYSFGGMREKGTIIFHTDLSKYKQSIFKQKFYQAGLTYPVWFGYVDVSTEEQFREAAKVGGNIRLTDNIKIVVDKEKYTGEVEFYNNSIVDLNGFTIEADAPIYNTEKAEHGLIGIWDCEVLFTDCSANHDGCVKAFDNSDIVKSKAYPAIGESNQYWEWEGYRTQGGKEYPYWHPRESRCFYVRSDIPTKAQGSLEISAGKYYGNCTVVFNYNTTVYIDDFYSEQTSYDTYKGEYAPEFHVMSPCFDVPRSTIPTEGIKYDKPCEEMLNCMESTYETGKATFQCWGGKYFAKMNTNDQLYYFNPAYSTCDYRTLGNADWTKITVDGVKIPIAAGFKLDGEGLNSYHMVIPLISSEE